MLPRWTVPKLALWTLFAACGLGCGAGVLPLWLLAEEPAAHSHLPLRRALLIGVSRYPNLAERYQLQGPENDVELMRGMLREQFGVAEENLRVLSEVEGQRDSKRLPTRTNIERAFRELAADAESGDYVVVFLAGHGSQQPEVDASGEPERDGLDEIFLPRDIGQWDGAAGSVANAVTDNEIGEWLDAIREKGASVWLIVDTCHAGTLLRGVGETVRQVPPDAGLGIPAAAISKARDEAAVLFGASGTTSREQSQPQATASRRGPKGGTVAFYACQSNEVTIERAMPRRGTDARPHGLFTFTLVEALTQAAGSSKQPIRYGQIMRQIRTRYAREGRNFPMPFCEGEDVGREVLGDQQWGGGTGILVSADNRINAGTLHGVTQGSILELLPAASDADKPLGHVHVTQQETFFSTIEPLAFRGLPAPQDVPIGSRCRMVYAALDDPRIRVAVDDRDVAGEALAGPQRRQLSDLLRRQSGADSLLVLADSVDQADWIVRPQRENLYLLAASEWSQSGLTAESRSFGPIAVSLLPENLRRIARAENLKRIAADASSSLLRGDDDLQISVQLRRRDGPADKEGVFAVPWHSGLTFFAQDRIVFQVSNPNPFAVDVNLLYLDSAYGVTCLFPYEGEYNRLLPGETVPVYATLTAETVGVEHLIITAVKAEGERIDLSCLEQPSLRAAQEVAKLRGAAGAKSLESPLGRLLQTALFAGGRNRTKGFEPAEVKTYQMDLISWRVRPERRSAGAEQP